MGVISDTHGRLDDEVLELFAGVDRIVHAGDVGDERVLARLALVAPVTAVHGNMDAGLSTGGPAGRGHARGRCACGSSSAT